MRLAAFVCSGQFLSRCFFFRFAALFSDCRRELLVDSPRLVFRLCFVFCSGFASLRFAYFPVLFCFQWIFSLFRRGLESLVLGLFRLDLVWFCLVWFLLVWLVSWLVRLGLVWFGWVGLGSVWFNFVRSHSDCRFGCWFGVICLGLVWFRLFFRSVCFQFSIRFALL